LSIQPGTFYSFGPHSQSLNLRSLSKSVVNVIPDFSQSGANPSVAQLKSRCEGAKPLGLVRCNASELLVVYDSTFFLAKNAI
jgi:hypothetical protein